MPWIDVVCGKGNNGGDGFVAARHLPERGVRVQCFLAGEPEAVKSDARVNLDICRKLGIRVEPFEELDPSDLEGQFVIDALLGTGFKGAPAGAVAAGIRGINEAMRPTLCVDVPSGIDADTGRAPLYSPAPWESSSTPSTRSIFPTCSRCCGSGR